MKSFNIHIIGVGGQGIGLLSEVIIRAADHAGLEVRGVDTHGLAQRGGIVVSRVRLGQGIHSPLIAAGRADLVVALERQEALRGMNTALRDGGTLLYYDAEWQPLEVRLKSKDAVRDAVINDEAEKRGIRVVKVFKSDLDDARRQNIVLLARMEKDRLIPGLRAEHYKQAMDDLMTGDMLEKNLRLFEKETAA